MIEAVQKVWRDYPYQRINHMWLSIQSNLNGIMEHDGGGGNKYELVDMSKLKLKCEKKLPIALQVSAAAVDLVEENFDRDFAFAIHTRLTARDSMP
jgi:hypothetical protein